MSYEDALKLLFGGAVVGGAICGAVVVLGVGTVVGVGAYAVRSTNPTVRTTAKALGGVILISAASLGVRSVVRQRHTAKKIK